MVLLKKKISFYNVFKESFVGFSSVLGIFSSSSGK
jgi:hypothetical protein